jgi:hypothetical protein
MLLGSSEAFSKSIQIELTAFTQWQGMLRHEDSDDKTTVRTLVWTNGKHFHFGVAYTNNGNIRFHEEDRHSPYYNPEYIAVDYLGDYNGRNQIRVSYGPLDEVKRDFLSPAGEGFYALVSQHNVAIDKRDGTYFHLFVPLAERAAQPGAVTCSEVAGLLLKHTSFHPEAVNTLLEIADHAADRDYKDRVRKLYFDDFVRL